MALWRRWMSLTPEAGSFVPGALKIAPSSKAKVCDIVL
jgi:hypothetical protein